MIRFLLIGLLLSCGSDISVITVEKRGDDTAIVSEPEALDTQTSEPGAEDTGCLLYTSPSPRDNGRSRMPSSA